MNPRKQTHLEAPSDRRRTEFLDAVERSRTLHARWVHPPRSKAEFEAYLQRLGTDAHAGYWVMTDRGELAGAVHISEIVRGPFCSGYLGFYAFVPHNGRGHMSRGLAAVLARAFGPLRLHRLEANIQAGNEASRSLVERLRFRHEGYSPRYLKIAGRWRDHERWAMTVEDWKAARRTDRSPNHRTRVRRSL